MKIVRLLFLLVMIAGCKGEDTPSTVGIDYLDEVLDRMQVSALKRKTIDWPTFRANVHTKIVDGSTIEGVFPAIEFALKSLGDNHSTYYAANSTVISGNANGPCEGTSGDVAAIANIGYVKIAVTGSNTAQHAQYATDIQTKIKNQDNANVKGWIIDLRGNTGGFMAPMIAGVGPIIGNGIAGYFIDAENNEIPYSYSDGTTTFGGSTTTYVTTFYKLTGDHPKVAILIDQRTASSGEGVAIALLALTNSKSFGVATCGQSTSVSGFDLSDGATLALADSYIADRNKKKNGGSIIPDVTVAGDQQVVNKAVEWINEP